MLILTLKTDNPDAELGLFEDKTRLQYVSFLAHRTLAENLPKKIEQLLNQQNLNWQSIQGIVCYLGPGSFTGLRIGLSLANACAYSLKVPIVGSETTKWREIGIDRLLKGDDQKQVLPHYGSEPHITKQKK